MPDDRHSNPDKIIDNNNDGKGGSCVPIFRNDKIQRGGLVENPGSGVYFTSAREETLPEKNVFYSGNKKGKKGVPYGRRGQRKTKDPRSTDQNHIGLGE